MDLQVKVEELENSRVCLEITVPAGDVELAIDKAAKKMANKVAIPGFRKGKVPRNILENYVGKEALQEEAAGDLCTEAYFQALDDNKIEALDEPKVELGKMELGKDCSFKATVSVMPKIVLGEYKGLQVEKKVEPVTDEAIDAELKKAQEHLAKIKPLADDEKAQDGDMLLINFEGFIDDQPFEGGKAENYSLQLGSHTFIPGFEEKLLGVSNGAQVDVNVTFPEDYPKGDVAGKPALFKVEVKRVRRKELPELNDEFAQQISEECDTLEALKTKIAADLKINNEQAAENTVRSAVLTKAVENTSFAVPEVLIERRQQQYIDDFANNLSYQGLTMKEFYEATKSNEEMLRKQYRDMSVNAVKQDLVLEEIVKAENITATDEEYNEHVAAIAKTYNQPVETLLKAFGADNSKNYVLHGICINKALQLLVDNAVITNIEA